MYLNSRLKIKAPKGCCRVGALVSIKFGKTVLKLYILVRFKFDDFNAQYQKNSQIAKLKHRQSFPLYGIAISTINKPGVLGILKYSQTCGIYKDLHNTVSTKGIVLSYKAAKQNKY